MNKSTIILSTAFALSCTTESYTPERVEPSFIQVTIEGELGSPEAPLDFTSEAITRTISIQTLDYNSDPYHMNGDLKLHVRPGKVASGEIVNGETFDPYITIENGQWTGEVPFKNAFGPARIWVSDEGDKDIESERKASFATGLSDTIHFEFPTITDFNKIDDTETNHLDREFTEVQTEGRDVRVTVVGTSGFWVTDFAEQGSANCLTNESCYNSLFVYTFQKPQGVRPGYKLILLTGGNQEYLGTTQFSFPDYLYEEGSMTIEPAELTETELCDDATMEGLESAVVKIDSATIPTTFTSSSEDYEDYLEYGQWPIDVGSCTGRIFVDSSALSYVFNPSDSAGAPITVQGLVTQIWRKWVVVLYDDNGLSGITPTSISSGSNGPRRPAPRPQ